MDQKQVLMQVCLDLSKAATDVFDLIDEEGLDAPMETIDHILKLKAIVDNAETLRSYYFQRNIQRMLSLGVPASHLMEMAMRGRSGA